MMSHDLFSPASRWIWMDGAADVNCYLQFLTEFVSAEKQPLELRLSAEGQYAVFADGKYLPSTQYPDYPQRKSVQNIGFTVENDGVHTLEIQVWHSGADTSVTRKEKPGLRFELRQGERILTASGTDINVRPLAGYRSGPVANITGQLGVGFSWREGLPEPWRKALAVDKPCVLVPRPIPELTVCEMQPARLCSQGVFTAHESGLQQFAALSFRQREQLTDRPEDDLVSGNGVRYVSDEADGIYLVLDLGQESVGYLDIDAVCPAATRVDIGFGEHLDDLRVRTDVGGRHFTVGWEAGTQRKPFVHRFLRLGGRYLQLFFYGHDVTVYHVGIQKVEYPVRGDGTFQSSDRLMDKIFEVSKNTLRCSMHEHYEDCPWREQALYAMDSRNQMLSGYYAFGEFTQPKASLRTLVLSLREDGLLELCAPARVSVDIPSFSLIFVTALEEYCRYSGDLEFGREMLPVAGTILRTFHGQFREGRMYALPGYWNFYEWRPGLSGWQEPPVSAESPLQLFYLLALQRMEKLCGYLGVTTPGLSEEISAVTLGLEDFWSEQEGAYASYIRDGEKSHYAQLVQALVLYTDSCPETRRQELCRKLLEDDFVPVSLAYSIFKYEALLQQSRDYAEEVFRQIEDRWGKMLYQGATTFWETDEGARDFSWAGSLCHGWSGIPAYLFGAYILSVRPEQPGVWKEMNEEACMYFAQGKLLTPQGEITVTRRKK